MHKKLVNEAHLQLSLSADGPILIKAGESGGLDPTLPDMEFVRTRGQVFLPGSSLKGAIRAHAERIVRSLQAEVGPGQGACDPLKRGEACGDRLERQQLDAREKYRRSCFICRLFGNTAVAGRIAMADALPTGKVQLEERNGVAIDRVFGSVAVGPFNYEVVTEGSFRTTISLKNFTLAQLTLLGLALRDIGAGRVGIGFGKSRGLGHVRLAWERLEVRYPLAALKQQAEETILRGVGDLAQEDGYGFPAEDHIGLPPGMAFEEDGWGSRFLVAEGDEAVQSLFRAAFSAWRNEVLRE